MASIKCIDMASIKCIDRSKYYNSIFAYVVLISPFQILIIFECHGYRDHEIILFNYENLVPENAMIANILFEKLKPFRKYKTKYLNVANKPVKSITNMLFFH